MEILLFHQNLAILAFRFAYRSLRYQDNNKFMTLNIDIFSDLVCPWCFISKRRLSKAIRLLDGRSKINVTWYLFQLNPQMPPEGMDRKAYRTVKFGSWSKSLELDAQVVEVGASEGIHFVFDRIQRTPNTQEQTSISLASWKGRHSRCPGRSLVPKLLYPRKGY